MLLYGAVLGCLGPVLTIAAVLGGRSPFVAPLDKRDDADAAKRMFAEDQSDRPDEFERVQRVAGREGAGKRRGDGVHPR